MPALLRYIVRLPGWGDIMKKAGLLYGLILFLLLGAFFALGESATLSYNSQGDAVTALQTRLAELGYYTFRVTGVYQEHTQRAVSAFQADNGLSATGVADSALLAMIHSADARPAPTPMPTPTPPPLNLLSPFPGKVQYGSKGEDVRRVQTRLSQLGYYSGDISGEFWNNTQNATREFQRQNALKVDGVVEETTWAALFFDGEAVDAYATPRPTPEPTPVPYQVRIDVTNQVTTVYGLSETSEYTEIVKQMICSTGTQQDATAPGTYILNGSKARWSYFPKWGTHAQYWTRIDAYNAFHSVIYREPDSMALATGSYTGLGKRASHGCIRLMLEDAKWIYENIGKGTAVIVYEGESDPELTQALRVPQLDKGTMLPVPTPLPTEPPAYSADALPPMPFTTLRKGAESEAVYFLQCKLRDLGYYNGTVTGGYYEGTIEAVKRFQRENGLSADGLAGKATLSMLYADVLAAPSPTPERAEPSEARPAPTVPPRNRTGTEPTASATPMNTPAPTADDSARWFPVTP